MQSSDATFTAAARENNLLSRARAKTHRHVTLTSLPSCVGKSGRDAKSECNDVMGEYLVDYTVANDGYLVMDIG